MIVAPDGERLRLERIEDLGAFRDDWERLAEVTGHPFATWDWNSLWWDVFGAGRQLYCFACRDEGGQVRAILPLYIAKRWPVGLARLLGYMDVNSPLAAPGDRAMVGVALRAITRRPYECRLILLESLPGNEWGDELGGRLLEETEEFVLPIDGREWEEILGSRGRKTRATLRKGEAGLKEHGLEFRLADDPARIDADVEQLFRLHERRWGGETTGIFEGPLGEFNRRFIPLGLKRGWLRLWFLEVDGTPTAVLLGWRYGDGWWAYQAGRDGRYEEFSVGVVLMSRTIRAACEEGVGTYHFMAGANPYKKRLSDGESPVQTRLLGPPRLTALAVRTLKAARSPRIAKLRSLARRSG